MDKNQASQIRHELTSIERLIQVDVEMIIERYAHEYGVFIDISAYTQHEELVDGRREFIGHSVNIEVKI